MRLYCRIKCWIIIDYTSFRLNVHFGIAQNEPKG